MLLTRVKSGHHFVHDGLQDSIWPTNNKVMKKISNARYHQQFAAATAAPNAATTTAATKFLPSNAYIAQCLSSARMRRPLENNDLAIPDQLLAVNCYSVIAPCHLSYINLHNTFEKYSGAEMRSS